MVKIGLESLNQLIKTSHKCLEILQKAKIEASRAVSSQSTQKEPKLEKTLFTRQRYPGFLSEMLLQLSGMHGRQNSEIYFFIGIF